MDAAERAALKAAVDAAVRARVEAENRALLADRGGDADLCSGCEMPRSDFTPGCKICWNRHRQWQAGRRAYPYAGGPDPSLFARMRLFSTQLEIDRMRENIEAARQARGIGWKVVA